MKLRLALYVLLAVIVFLGLAETSSYPQEYEGGFSEAVSLIYENDLALVYRLPPKGILEETSEEAASFILQQLVQKGLTDIVAKVTSVLASKLGGLFLTFISEMPEVGILTKTNIVVLTGNELTNTVQSNRSFLPFIVVTAGTSFDYGVVLTLNRSTGLYKWEIERRVQLLDFEELSALFQQEMLQYGDRFLVALKEPFQLLTTGKYQLFAKAWCESEGRSTYRIQIVELLKKQSEYTYPSRTSPSATFTTLFLSILYGDKNIYQKCFTTTASNYLLHSSDQSSMESDLLEDWLQARTMEFDQFYSEQGFSPNDISGKAWAQKLYDGLRGCSNEDELLNELPGIFYLAFTETVQFFPTTRLAVIILWESSLLFIEESGEYKLDSEFPDSVNKDVQYELTKWALNLAADGCQTYHQTRNSYPSDLEEIKNIEVEMVLGLSGPLEAILSTISFFGAYQYLAFADGFIVYSPGPDEDDDRARVKFGREKGFDSDGDIVLASSADVYKQYLDSPDNKPQSSSSGLVYIELNEQGYEEYRHLKDATVMIKIPAGEFLMGFTEQQIEEMAKEEVARSGGDVNTLISWVRDRFFPHKVHVDAYYIDKYEVTNEQFERFVEETGYITDAERYGKGLIRYKRTRKFVEKEGANWRHPQGPGSGISGKMNHPVVQISWNDAQAYAKWVGKRLPAEAEWEKAARGDLIGKKYSWGNSIDLSRANYYSIFRPPFFRIEISSTTTPVGDYPPNGYGLYDMAGNVAEPCADYYDEDYYSQSPYKNPQGPAYGGNRVLRGGSWTTSAESLRCASRNPINPHLSYDFVGFRCSKSVE